MMIRKADELVAHEADAISRPSLRRYIPAPSLMLGVCMLVQPGIAKTCEETEPPHTQEQCLSSVDRLSQLEVYRLYLSTPLVHKRETIQSFGKIRAILEPEYPTITECWVHYKHLNLTDILSSLGITMIGYEITYPNREALLQHDIIFEIYARDQLKVLSDVSAYKRQGLGTAVQPSQP